MKILVYTDSRGQHKPAGSSHKIFGERLRDDTVEDIDVTLVLCPMKWTTTLDFYEYSLKNDLSQYDWIILHTGIVEWSPRPITSAYNDLYNNTNELNLETSILNTRDYSKKIVNNKKECFDYFFGETQINNYLKKPFDIDFAGEKTINMYSLEMAHDFLIPWLKNFTNLVFISANKVLPDWKGDHNKGRPDNMEVIDKYSKLFSSQLPSQRVLDLNSWSREEVKKYTCDNMHLTKEGSDYIFDGICNIIGLGVGNKGQLKWKKINQNLEKNLDNLVKFKKIEIFTSEKKDKFLKSISNSKPLATLIIGFKLAEYDPSRLSNLLFLLKWLEYYYHGLFDVLLVEQDSSQKFDRVKTKLGSYVRYEFLYNPNDYNRGWGYNVAVKHFCNDSKVVVLMDTDVLTGDNFVSEVRDCFIGKFDVISPYQNIYYTDEKEVENLKKSMKLLGLSDVKKIKNPVTITGGVVIFNRNTFMALKGFEQYIGYGCEDRSLDVAVLSLCNEDKVRIASRAYIHLYHPSDTKSRKNFDIIYQHLVKNYQCSWHPSLVSSDFIHLKCEHSNKEKILKLIIKRTNSFGDKELYCTGAELSCNGVLEDIYKTPPKTVVLPPDFKGLVDYRERELYDAPPPDVEELAMFHNAFLGERCFIIGNGPSLNKHDLSFIENEYTFGVNSFYYKTRETGFRPFFYVVEDSSVMKENIGEIRDYYAPFKFFPTIYKQLHSKEPNTFFFNMNRGFYEKSSPNYAVPRFSTDATTELYCGQSVTYINLQLAYFMGFTEVYLIGMDFSYIIPDTHKRTGDVLLSDTDDENHFHKDYFGKGKTWKDPKLERVGMNYKMAKVVYESVGRKIYNATIGGSLEIFDRVNYLSLFDTSDLVKKDIEGIPIEDTFRYANELYREKKFLEALDFYIRLAEGRPDFSLYKKAVKDCYSQIKLLNKDVHPDIKERFDALI